MTDKTKVYWLIFIGALAGGVVPTVTKIGLIDIPPFTFSFLRFCLASVFILPFFLKKPPRLDVYFWQLVLISILPVLNIVFFVWGVKLTTASIAGLLQTAIPIITGLFSLFLLDEKISGKKWFFLVVGLLGVLYAIFLPFIEKNGYIAGDITGNFFIFMGVIFYSLYIVVSKKFQEKYPLITIVSGFIFLSTIVFFILSLTELDTGLMALGHIPPKSWLAILYLSIPISVGGYLIGQYKIKLAGPLVTALTFYLMPIVGYFSAVALLGEKITPGLLIGTIFVLVSITLTTYAK